ncbi:MAG: protein phosphatase 2C domain-containing protein [Cyanobacteria bacterium J06641_5]
MAPLHCPNLTCQAANALEDLVCRTCKTPLLRPYLHLLGENAGELAVGTVLADRYTIVAPGFAIDTKPARIQPEPEQIPEFILPYLRLSPQQPHTPHAYGFALQPQSAPIWLLAYGYFRKDLVLQGTALPTIESLWPEVSARRQLNWLWQMARLWRPLRAQGVVGALLDPSLLRASGALLQLLELPLSSDREIRLPQLVPLWARWAGLTTGPVRDLLLQVCEGLGTGQITKSKQLVDLFGRTLQKAGGENQQIYEVSSHTSAGPKRGHNEDAFLQGGRCANESPESPTEALAVVCDGVGGQDGGEVAAQLAVEVLRDCLDAPPVPAQDDLLAAIEGAIFEANARICERNDREQRQARQRMGTTLALVALCDRIAHLAHVGDSRVYYISRSGCFQLTLDDDVATRATRLGHAIHANALLQANAGSLVQALGVGSSKVLHPTLQSLVLDEDCVFLLCSDGLSDYDRVEQYWERELLPVLAGKIALEKTSRRLVALADRVNGHDNTTVSLVHCQFPDADTVGDDSSIVGAFSQLLTASQIGDVSELPTTAREEPQRRSPLPKVILTCSLVLTTAAAAYWLIPSVRSRVNTFLESWLPVQLPPTQGEKDYP